LAELEELEQQDLEEKLLDVGPAVDVELPSVPSALPAEPSRGMTKTAPSCNEICCSVAQLIFPRNFPQYVLTNTAFSSVHVFS